MAVELAHAEGTVRERALTHLVADFEELHPGVDVTLRRVAGGGSALLEQWGEQAPDDRPELALLPQSATGRLVDSGQTVAPGRCLDAVVPDMLPAVEAAWSVGDLLQAVPFGVSTPVLLYDRRLFRAAGLDPDDPPASLGEVREASERVVDAGVADVGLVVDAGPDSGGAWFVEQWAAQTGEASVAPGNGRRHRAERVTWDEGPAAERLGWLRRMIEDDLAVSVGRNRNGRENLERAVDRSSRAVMAVHTSGALAELVHAIQDVVPGGSFDLGVAPLPGPGEGSFPGGSALWMAGGQPPEEEAATWLLASYLASAPADARWAAATGYVPLSRTAGRREPLRSVWERHPGIAVAHQVLATQGSDPEDVGPVVGPATEMRTLLAEAVDEALRGADAQDALAEAATDANRLLAAYAAGAPG